MGGGQNTEEEKKNELCIDFVYRAYVYILPRFRLSHHETVEDLRVPEQGYCVPCTLFGLKGFCLYLDVWRLLK